MIYTLLIGFGCFLAGVLFSAAVKVWFGKQEASLHDKLDTLLKKVDPNATQPPQK